MDGFKYTYEEFPGWSDRCEGMKVIPGDKNNTYVIHQVVRYAVKDDYKLHIHFLFPETLDTAVKYPLLIHVRGSAWLEQNMTGLIAPFTPIVRSGVAVAFVQYRPVTVARFPAQIRDLKTATRFIMAHADEYPIDTRSIFLSGDSSGGHTAILGYLSWNEDVLENEDEHEKLPPLRGLIDFYGVTDVGELAHTETGYPVETNARLGEELFEVSSAVRPQNYEEASAFSYVDLRKTLEPVLILHGNKDRLVPLSQSVRLYEALVDRGTECEFDMIDQADHGHGVFWCEAVTDIITAFLHRHK